MVAAIPHRDFSGSWIKKKEEYKEDKRKKKKKNIQRARAGARAPSASLPEEG